MKFILSSLLITSVLFSESSASQFDPGSWTQLSATARHLRDVQMLDYNTIIVVGGNEFNDAITSVLRSNDRGATWTSIMDIPFSPWLQAVHFPSMTKGFAAGYDGILVRTDDGGLSWETLQLPNQVALRDYNDVYFISETVGFLVGGNQTNDSILTILKTVDGGNSWQIIEDRPGAWLRSVQFVSPQVGFASGELGTLLKTTDGGDTWSEIPLSGNLSHRHYNNIRFANDMTGFAVGGQEKNDSIRTILRTTDGGMSWQSLIDNPSSWLNAIEITPSGMLIAVGNDSTILSSADGGETWEKEIIPTSMNWPVNLNAVDFIYGTLGIVVGDYGQMLFYDGNLPFKPSVALHTPTIVASDSIVISGTVSAHGHDTHVFFDYGPTPNLGITVAAYPSLATGTDTIIVEALITGIDPGIYYYRIRAENDGGIALTETRQFYIGDLYEELNLDFEHWNEHAYDLPDEWTSVGLPTKSPSYDGTYAASLTGSAQQSVTAIIWGDMDGGQFTGGFPTSSIPDSVVGYFNYNIIPSTEGLVFLILQKNGVTLSSEMHPITGSTAGIFQRLAFAVDYAGSETPNTIVLGITNNNVFSQSSATSSENLIAVDNMAFISTVPILIPNSDFEDWHGIYATFPDKWFTYDQQEDPMSNSTVFRSEDAQHGNYAAVVKNWLEFNVPAQIQTSNSDRSDGPCFPVAGKHVTFNGYYKFDMQSIFDTVHVQVNFFQAGVEVGVGDTVFYNSVGDYTPFEVRLNYYPASVMPDSASIKFVMGSENAVLGTSTLYLDNLSFDGFVTPYEPSVITAVEEAPSDHASTILVYPNPSNGLVTIEVSGPQTIDQLSVYNLGGSLIMQHNATSNRIQLDMGRQPKGLYFLRMFSETSGQWQTKKLVLE